jgi:ribonuclease P protein component
MSMRSRFSFPNRFRLRRRMEFQRVMDHGKYQGDRRLQIWALPNQLGHSRLGLVVGRRHGNAVRRHRIKRILREAFRLSRDRLPSGLDLACAPRVGAKIELRDAMASLERVTKRLAGKFSGA